METIKDGTRIKHDAAIVNANVQKEELRVKMTSLHDKIQMGEQMKRLRSHSGFQLIEAKWQREYPYTKVVDAYAKGGNSKEVDKIIFGRAAIDDTYKYMQFVEDLAQKASEELSRQEAAEKKKN
jgi:hypothetical protein